MSAFVIPSIFTAVDKFSAPVRRMSANIGKFAQRAEIGVSRAERTFRRLTPSLGSATKQLLSFASTAAITAGIIGGITFSVNAIKEFEVGLVGVGKTTGIANVALKELGRDIVFASDQLKTINSAKLLELAESAGQLGVKGSENIIKFAVTLAKLEKASDIQGEEGAKSIARLLTITKEGVGIVDQFASTLVALGNASAASESEILSVASEVGRATAAYKLNSQEILGIAASLKSLDVAPEAAGSAIGKVFRGIELATIKGGDKLKAFANVIGITPKEVTKAFGESPRKTFTLFIKGLGRISDEGGSVAKALIDAGLSGERVSKGIIPLATNFQLLEDKLKLSTEAFIENKALEEEFAAAQKTVTSAINSISRAWTNLVITQATAGSSLETVQKALFSVSDNLGTIVKAVGTFAAVLIGLKATLFIARTSMNLYNISLGVFTALQGRSAFALRGSTIALNAYSFVTRAATVIQWLWNAALTANPIGLVIAGIAGLIAFIILATNKWDSWTSSLLNSLGPLGSAIKLMASFNSSLALFRGAFEKGGLKAGVSAVTLNVLKVARTIPEFQNQLGPAQADALRKILEKNIGGDTAQTPVPVNVVADTQAAVKVERTETSENKNVIVRIQDETGRARIEPPTLSPEVVLENTFIPL